MIETIGGIAWIIWVLFLRKKKQEPPKKDNMVEYYFLADLGK